MIRIRGSQITAYQHWIDNGPFLFPISFNATFKVVY